MSSEIELKVGQRWVYKADDALEADETITEIGGRSVYSVAADGYRGDRPIGEFRESFSRLRRDDELPGYVAPVAAWRPAVGDWVTVTASADELRAYRSGALTGHTYKVGMVLPTHVRLQGIPLRNGPDVEFSHIRHTTVSEVCSARFVTAEHAAEPTEIAYHGEVNGILRLDDRPDFCGVQIHMNNGTEPVGVEVPFADVPRLGDRCRIVFVR